MSRTARVKAALVALGAAAAIASTTLPSAAQPVVRFAGNPAGAPFTYLDAATNTMKGICIDLLVEIGAIAGFQVEATAMPVGDQLAALNANATDAICAQISPARLEQAAFSDPIHLYGEGLFVRANDTGTYATWEDLRGEIVGATTGTPWATPMQQSGIFAEVRLFPTLTEVMQAVISGQLKGGFAASPLLVYQITVQGQQPDLRVPLPFEARVTAPNGFGVRKTDTALLGQINAALAQLFANGRVAQIFADWGLELNRPAN